MEAEKRKLKKLIAENKVSKEDALRALKTFQQARQEGFELSIEQVLKAQYDSENNTQANDTLNNKNSLSLPMVAFIIFAILATVSISFVYLYDNSKHDEISQLQKDLKAKRKTLNKKIEEHKKNNKITFLDSKKGFTGIGHKDDFKKFINERSEIAQIQLKIKELNDSLFFK